MSNRYQPIPSSESLETSAGPDGFDDSSARDPSHRPLRAAIEAELQRPPPPWYQRFLLIVAMLVMAWGAIKLGGWHSDPNPQIIYASRYSEEFRYRPAASPVITEHLKDGRIRLRGATYGGVGVREEDLPMTPERKAAEEKKRVEEAREAAKAKLGIKSRRGKNKGKRGAL